MLSLTLGVRSSQVRYESDDHYIVGPNPDDSGIAHLLQHQPGRRRRLARGRQPQRLRELRAGIRDADVRRARLPARRPRPQLALDPATSHRLRDRRQGASRRRTSASISRRSPSTTDQEIVIDTATGGRTTYRNAGKTRRRGVEAAWDGDLGSGFAAHVNYTYLLAEFADAVRIRHAAGRRARGRRGCRACRRSRRTASSPGRPAATAASTSRGEVQYVGQHLRQRPQHRLRAGLHDRQRARRASRRQAGRAAVLASSCASTTSPNVNYVGSVIVGDTNGRYFEPAPGRNWFAGVSVNAAF